MRRRTFDTLMSIAGLLIAVVLVVAGGLLTWGHNYITDEVHDQLAAQKIFFPPADSPAVAGPEFVEMRKYGGQQLLTGAQARVYADDFIAVHLKESGGGLTYSELSAKSMANPTDTELAAQVETQFRGETLRGLLLNAYAFGTMGQIAGIAAIAAFVGGGVMLILSGLGLYHSRKTPPDAEILVD
ncbi:MAG TPA: hypothetical protein VL068_08105 [Microthrixaceae bacterium]|nr:hypothetical protein [Microthrixaceae bacterium]